MLFTKVEGGYTVFQQLTSTKKSSRELLTTALIIAFTLENMALTCNIARWILILQSNADEIYPFNRLRFALGHALLQIFHLGIAAFLLV